MVRNETYCIIFEPSELSGTLIQSLKSSNSAGDGSKDLLKSLVADHLDSRRSDFYLDNLDMYYKGTYVTAETITADLGEGLIHLYKGNLEEDLIMSKTPSKAFDDQVNCGNVLAILAVPSYMTSTDLLGFFGDSLRKISHLRILRSDLRRYMVLLKFRSTMEAVDFRMKFNGALFNPMEPESVHCVPISYISIGGMLKPATEFPALTSQAQEGSRINSKLSQKAMPPITNLTELPTCVVCLERMDAAATGLLTIACEHTFHCDCISKWVDTQATCPICRFSVARDALEDPEKRCSSGQCSSERNLWMCLICGTVNCGRYESKHAVNHFEKFGHAFAMDLESGRIWDYSSDSYVHRLLQDKIGASSSGSKSGTIPKEDEYGSIEFEELLATQLESQRLYYEEQLTAAVRKAAATAAELKKSRDQSESLATELQHAKLTLKSEQSEVSSTKASQEQALRKAKVLSDLARKTQKQYEEEKSMNSSLLEKLAFLNTKLASAETEKKEIQLELADQSDQVRDLMVHFASVDSVAKLDASELESATIQVAPAATKSKKKTKSSGTKK